MMDSTKAIKARVPDSTYRLQFNHQFTFEMAAEVVAYLHDLGVSDCYSSPVQMARPGSLHGYDIVNHTKINPELGTEEQFQTFAQQLRQRAMGLLIDVVPNHMCIAGSENGWWLDLLENGPGSTYARFFDVDWRPPNPNLTDKVLLPILGDQYGRLLEGQEIKISYRGGAFFANYYETSLPIASRSSAQILELALSDLKTRLAESHPEVLELESIITTLGYLPPRTARDASSLKERRREKEVVKRRISALAKQSGEARHSIHEALIKLNGVKGDPASFDRLERLLAEQAYRLSYWRVASDEINYRRFFDINELAAVRVEERPVFKSVHEIIFRLIKQGVVTGLRIDHVDGLFNPEKYLHDLRRECLAAKGNDAGNAPDKDEAVPAGRDAAARPELPFYVIVEKILGHDEELRHEWPVHGTTGYDFMNLLNGLFVDTSNAEAFHQLYRDCTGSNVNFAQLLYECKKLILSVAMSSELHVLARKLDRISEQHRWSRDFTFNSLQMGLSEVIASFPVYRSYIRRQHTTVSENDRRYIKAALRAAKRRNPAVSESLFDFIGSVLLLDDPKGITTEQRAERRDFVMRFQQLTSPVTAKGLEDTAFYRYYPLASLNEVGGEPNVFGITLAQFHARSGERQRRWPHTLSATSTHDTKRSEDVRARINVLSEMPAEWLQAVTRWRELNRGNKIELDGTEVPDANEEYLLYQTLVGAWPLLEPPDGAGREEFISRIQEYMNKALKEAKVHTSWISPNEEYDRAVREFVQTILTPGDGNRFLPDFVEFQKTTARLGLFNSLSQTLLKIASPGVPDIYQGTEIWNFSLVDPDNRRPVDYERLAALLASLDEEETTGSVALVDRLMRTPEDERLKLYVTSRTLRFRRAHAELFRAGMYLPLAAEGGRADHVVAYARRHGEQECIVAAARFFARLTQGQASLSPLGADVWGETILPLSEITAGARYRDLFTGDEFELRADGQGLPLARLFAHLPLTLLERL